MTCKNCGREINDGSVFCPHCGATQAISPESPWNAASGSAVPAWEGPEGGGKKKKTGLFIGIGVAAVAVIALVAVFAGGLFSNPKKQVEAAFVKSAAAYVQAEKALNLPDTAQGQRSGRLRPVRPRRPGAGFSYRLYRRGPPDVLRAGGLLG